MSTLSEQFAREEKARKAAAKKKKAEAKKVKDEADLDTPSL